MRICLFSVRLCYCTQTKSRAKLWLFFCLLQTFLIIFSPNNKKSLRVHISIRNKKKITNIVMSKSKTKVRIRVQTIIRPHLCHKKQRKGRRHIAVSVSENQDCGAAPFIYHLKKRCGAPCLTMGKSEFDTTHKQYESYA